VSSRLKELPSTLQWLIPTRLILLGKVCRNVFPKTGTLDPMAGQIAYVSGFLVAIIIWGFGLLWFCFALVAIYRSRPLPFNMGWWGFTFPLGVYSACTLQIGMELDSMFFKVLGTVSDPERHESVNIPNILDLDICHSRLSTLGCSCSWDCKRS
jgi:Voltage-dependent anion channel